MNTQLLIDAIVQQTMVFIAQLATAGGLRAPLAHVADRVFVDLTSELHNQGVRKKVIADMFGMALRTYHRRVRELSSSRTDGGRTLWEAVLEFLREKQPVSAREVHRRFRHDDPEILSGVLNDLVSSALAYRAGRGETATYRAADEADFAVDDESRVEAREYLVWLTVYRQGPLDLERAASLARIDPNACRQALEALVAAGRVHRRDVGGRSEYEADEFTVPLGTSHGWEAAVLDHVQAMMTAIGAKLSLGTSRSRADDVVGGSTWSLDVWDGHPLEREALGTLARVRAEVEALRRRVDAHGAQPAAAGERRRVIFYMGQYVRDEGTADDEEKSNDENT
jgi:hypothetical protein